MLKAIIISDIHLGNPYSNWKQLELFLRQNPCKNLFLNGDIIDERYLQQNNKELSDDELSFFNWMIHIESTRTIYTIGNHENFNDDYRITDEGRLWNKYKVRVYRDTIYYPDYPKCWSKYHISHGHKTIFRNPITESPIILKLIDSTIRIISKLRKYHSGIIFKSGDLNVHKGVEFEILAENSRKFFKNGLKIVSRYRRKIRSYKNSYIGVICGHIHDPEIKRISKILYLNSGDWLENNTALIQKENDEWEIIKWEK